MKNGILKKSLSVFLAILMIVPTLFATGAAPLLSLFDGIVTEADAAITGIKIVVPETLYLTPSTGASTSVQYYINNNADGSVKTTTDTTASVHISYPGAKLTSISAKTSAAITLPTSITGLVGTTFGSSAATATGTFSLPAGLNPGGTALVEWTFVFDVNGQTKTHYAYSVAYAPWYLPVGAAARAVGAHHNVFSSSILWVSGAHGYAAGDSTNLHYPKADTFQPMLGLITAPSNTSPDTYIQSDSNGLSATISYQSISQSTVNYHARANSISPTATITVDTSRYNNFNQIPNFKVGFMVADRENAEEGKWYLADYGTNNGSSYYNGTARSGSRYDSDYNDQGTSFTYNDADTTCGVKYNAAWNKAISGTANFRLKSGVYGYHGGVIKSTSWNNNFVNISVTGANKAALRTAVLAGTSYAKENYTEATWNTYYAALKAAATNLCNPTSATVDASALTTAEAGLHTTLTLNANGGNLGTNVPLNVAMQVGGNPTTSFNNADVIGAYYATRTGYTFLGWSTDKNATSAPATVTVGLNDTVYAVWKANTYYAIFDNLIDYNAWNKAAGNGVVSDVTADGFTITSNDGAGEATSESPYFAVTPGKSYKIEMDITGTAWDVYIFFCDENGSWIDFADGPTNRYSTGGSTGVDPDNAVFTAPNKTEVVKAKIRVDANGSNNAVRFENIRVYEVGKVAEGVSYETAKLVTYDSPYGTLPTPVKTGYTFKGWLRHDGTNITESSVMKITENSYFTSQWTENRYTVAYNANGSNDAVEAPKTYNYTENVSIAAAIERVGHTFAGWKSDANGEIYQPGTTVPALTAENDVTVTLTAQWNINSYTLTFVNNAGTTVESKDYNYGTAGSDVTLPANTAAHYDGTNHYSYAWPTVADVTANATYNETKKTEAHVFTETVITDSTCTATGTKKLTCACGYETTEEIPMKAHSLAFVAKVDAKCGIAGTGEHYKCSVCGGLFADENGSTPVTAEQLVIPALEHQYGEVKHAATCTMGSYSTFTCALCNNTYSTTPADDLIEHPYVLTENNPEPDCTNAGVAHYTCSACGATKTEDLEALGHSMQFITGIPATCTSAGTIDHFKCTRCSGLFADADGENALDSIVDPIKDHTPGETAKENVVPATCTVAGSHEDVVKCTVCSTELSRTPVVDPVIAHTAAAAVEEGRVPSTCTVAGYYYNVVKCSVCSEELDRTKVDLDLAAHTEEILPATDSTCTVPGKTEGKKCSVCGEILVEQTDKALAPHTEATREEITLEATCGAPGSKNIITYCTVCNAVLDTVTEVIPATGAHTLGDYIIDLDPTCAQPGSKHKECSVCDYETAAEEIPATGAHVYANEVAGSRVDATCVATGKVTFACACGATEEQTLAIDSTNHANLVTDTAVAATCTATGLTEGQHCAACNVVTVAQQTTDKIAHTEDTREEVTLEATCGAEGKKNVITFCTVCKNDLKTVEESIPATGNHSYDEGVVTTEPKCETDGVKTFTCSVCDDSYTEPVAQLGHNYGEATCDNPATCTRCGSTTGVALGHDFTVFVETVDYTCTEQGYDIYKCSRCEETEKQNYTDAACRPEADYTVTKKATCEADGEKSIFCSVCKKATVTTVIAKREHVYKDNGVKTAATCVAEGVMNTICTNEETAEYAACKHESTRAIPVDEDAHALTQVEAKAATCEDIGWNAYEECSLCDYTTYKVIDKLGHDYVGVVTKEPTCTETGVMTYTCQNDSDHTYTETIKENGHTLTSVEAKAATCEAIGWDAYEYCSVCDYTTYAEIDALGHAYDAGVVTTEPTCTEKGEKTFTCANDKNHTYTEPISALGHIDADSDGYCDRADCGVLICNHEGEERITTDKVAATCTEDGYTGDTRCAKCNVILTEGKKIDRLGHAWSETFTSNGDGKDNTHYQTCTRANCGVQNTAVAHTWNDGVVTTDPTCEDEGVKTFTCTAKECGATYTEAVVANGHNYGTWIAEVPATCVETGTLGHYECSVCHKNFDADKAELTDLTIAINSNNHVTTTDHVQTDATCTDIGYTAGTFCEDCDKWISGHEEIAAINHKNKVHHEKVDATCVAEGTIEYWSCPDCSKNFSDEAFNTAVTDLTIEINPDNHAIVNHEAQAPTCTDIGWNAYDTCSRCDYTTYVEKAANGHAYDLTTGVTAEDGKHTVTCPNCDETTEGHTKVVDCTYAAGVVTAPTCTKDGYTTHTCIACGYFYTDTETTAVGHSFGAWTAIGNDQHSRTCTVCADEEGRVETADCSYGEWTETDAPDCVNKGEKAHTCTVCKNTVTAEVDSLGHAYGEADCNAPATCSRCGETTGEALGHDFSVFVETVDYTCTADGYTTYKCSRCDATENRDITTAAHRPATDYVVVEKASCDKAGYKAILCTACGEELETETIAKREHNLVDTTVEKAATCSATGIMNQKCDCAETAEYAACTYTTTRVIEIDADAHKWETEYTVDKKASCEEAGSKSYHCEYCDAINAESVVEIAKREHNLVDTTLALAPTCSATGTMNQKCDCAETAEYAACTYTTTRVIAIDADAHKAEAEYIQTVAPTCSAVGEEKLYCEYCDAVLDTREVAIVVDAHKAEAAYVQTIAPTCSAVGEEKLYCEYCDAVLDTREVAIDADAHKAEAEYIVMQKATCDQDGYKAILCEYCDAELCKETIAKRAHVYVDNGVATAATCVAEGVMNTICTNVETDTHAACTHESTRVIPVDPDAHKAEADYTVVKPATCEEDGYKAILCEYCDAQRSEQVVIDKLGHDYKLASLLRPTQGTDGTWGNGYVTYVCQNDRSHNYSELVNRADYSEYDAIVEKLEARLADSTLDAGVRAEIEKLLADNTVALDRIESEQADVTAKADALTEKGMIYQASYTVRFVDSDGTVLAVETVAHGSSATAPADPAREGFLFIGWNGNYTNVQADTTVTAEYHDGELVIMLDANMVKVAIGQTQQINATVIPADSDAELTWAVANSAIATVDANGVVTGVKNGSTTLTVSALNGKISKTVSVYVYDANKEYTVQLAKSPYGSFVVGDYYFNETAYIKVKAGEEFKFQFALNSNYDPNDLVITVNGQDLSLGEDNYFTIPVLTDSVTILAIPAPTADWDDSDNGNTGSNSTAHSCWCHSSNKLLQFIWKIFMLICKLFGIEQYHYCGCGAAHW